MAGVLWVVMVAACSSSSTERAGTSGGSRQGAERDAASSVEGNGLCDVFGALAAQREAKGAGEVRPGSTEAVPDGPEGWAQRIATTEQLAAVAPEELRDDAQTYVELVEARAALFEAHGYPSSLDEIPADATQSFIRDHADEQRAANRFIASASEECGVG
jgi:hypothetical protein